MEWYSAPPMDAKKELASIIRRTRQDSGLKQEVFAREVGIVAAHLSRLEHAQGLPSIQLLQKIADRFGADRSRMMRLLRIIKGFDEDPPIEVTQCAPSLRGRTRPLPVVTVKTCPAWVRALDKGEQPNGKPAALEPVTTKMSRDRRAFWMLAEGVEMCGGPVGAEDLLLVEPSMPVEAGQPVLLVQGKQVYVRLVRSADGEFLFDSLCPDQKPLPPGEGLRAYRIAGVRPCYRAFLPNPKSKG